MNILLDTHILIWWLNDDSKLPEIIRSKIADGNNLVFYSAVSIWEIRIKEALGKIELPDDFFNVLLAQKFESIDMTTEHANKLKDLPLFHRDPFDRMLITQAKSENLTLITADSAFQQYDVSLMRT